MSDDDKPIKKKLSKDNVYAKEQKAILEKIMDILGVIPDDEDSMITRDTIETKFDKVNKLYNEIKEYYSSKMTYGISITTNKEMSIIRSVLKHHGYKLDYNVKSYTDKDTNKKTSTQYYFIISNKK